MPCQAWGHLGVHQEELESAAGEEDVWNILMSLLPWQHDLR